MAHLEHIYWIVTSRGFPERPYRFKLLDENRQSSHVNTARSHSPCSDGIGSQHPTEGGGLRAGNRPHRRRLRHHQDYAPVGLTKPVVWRWQERFMQ